MQKLLLNRPVLDVRELLPSVIGECSKGNTLPLLLAEAHLLHNAVALQAGFAYTPVLEELQELRPQGLPPRFYAWSTMRSID